MNRCVAVVIIMGTGLFFSGCLSQPVPTTTSPVTKTATQSAAQNVDTTFQPFTAKFIIITNGTERKFSQTMYLHQSPDVYLAKADPTIVHVKKQGVSWADFFATLPFSVTTDCLITGTQQRFCNSTTQQLRFYLNHVETPAVLSQEIRPNDLLLIQYGD